MNNVKLLSTVMLAGILLGCESSPSKTNQVRNIQVSEQRAYIANEGTRIFGIYAKQSKMAAMIYDGNDISTTSIRFLSNERVYQEAVFSSEPLVPSPFHKERFHEGRAFKTNFMLKEWRKKPTEEERLERMERMQDSDTQFTVYYLPRSSSLSNHEWIRLAEFAIRAKKENKQVLITTYPTEPKRLGKLRLNIILDIMADRDVVPQIEMDTQTPTIRWYQKGKIRVEFVEEESNQ